MKISPLLTLLIGLLVGGGIVAIMPKSRPAGPSAPPAVATVDTRALDAANRRIADLQERLRASELANTPAPAPSPEQRAKDPAAAAAMDIKGLLQDSRPLLNRMAPMFQEGMNRGITQQVDRLASELGLDAGQKEALRAKLTALGAEEMKKFTSRLNDPNMTPDKLFQPQASPFSPDVLNATLKETLTPDQFSQYEKKETADRVARLERQANSQVERLGSRLNLSEEQKDQVFGVMVKSSDPSLQVETGTGADAGVSAGSDRDTAIRAILTPEQLKTYDEDAKREQDRRARWQGLFRGGK